MLISFLKASQHFWIELFCNYLIRSKSVCSESHYLYNHLVFKLVIRPCRRFNSRQHGLTSYFFMKLVVNGNQ